MLQDKLELFIDSVFMATLEYGHTVKMGPVVKLLVAGWVIMLSVIFSILAIRFVEREKKKQAGMFIAMLAATVFTFYSSGTVNGHYLIQVFPFIAILFFGYTLRVELRKAYLWYGLLVLALSFESLIEYARIIKQYQKHSTFYNGKAFIAVDKLRSLGLDNKKIFFADHHIGYWFLHQYPLAKSVTHPSSLSRPEFFKHFGNTNNSMEELKCIMEEINPDVIVSRKECLSFFHEDSEQNVYFMSRMRNYFELVYQNTNERVFIWRKKAVTTF